MDEHSENYAEDMETATTPVMVAGTYASLILSSIGTVACLLPTFKKQEQLKKELIKKYNIDKICDEVNRNGGLKSKFSSKRHYLRETELLNERQLKRLNFEDKNIPMKDLIKNAQEYGEKLKGFRRVYLIGAAVGSAVALTGIFLVNNFATKIQVVGSRFGRYQAREKLKNERYFVDYTDEQIQEAENELAKKTPEKGMFGLFKKKNKTDTRGFWGNLMHVFSDRKKYKEWKATDKDDSKKVTRELSQAEIQEAKADKEVIQRIVRKVNNKAEDYSENMETVANAVLLSGPLLGGALGTFGAWILQKTGVMQNIARKIIKRRTNKEGQKIFEELLKLEGQNKKNDMKVSLDYTKKLSELNYNISENSYQNSKKTKSLFKKFVEPYDKLLTHLMTTKTGRRWAGGLFGGIVAGAVSLYIGLKLQKNAGRAGRYIAKKELEKDPTNFISNDNKDIESVKDVKAQKEGKLKRFFKHISFMPRVIKEYFDYQKFKKTELQHQKDLNEELLKVKISDKQLKDAKNIQRKLFNTFERLDDKSQEYSETAELVNETGMQFASYGAMASIILVPAAVIGMVMKGKISIGKLAKWGLSFAAVSSLFTKGFLKRHTKAISENLFKVVNSVNVPFRTSKSPEEQLILNKTMESLKSSFKDFPSLMKKSDEILTGLAGNGTSKSDTAAILSSVIKKADLRESKNISDLFRRIASKLPEEEYKKMDALMNEFLYSCTTSFEKGKFTKKDLQAALPKIEKLLSNMPKEEFAKVVDTFFELLKNKPDEVMYLIKNEPKKLINCFLKSEAVSKLMTTATLTYAAANIALMYALMSYLAKFEKEAGRYGVMKGIESLDDYTYYANSEPTETANNITPSISPAQTVNINQKLVQQILNKKRA